MLSDTELVLGLSRHLSAFQMSTARAALGQIESAGQLFDLGFRLQRSGLNSPERVAAIATEVGIHGIILRTLVVYGEQLRWWTVERDVSGNPTSLSETVPAPARLVADSDAVLRLAGLTAVEYGVLVILRETSGRPLLETEGLHLAASSAGPLGPLGDEAAEEAVRHLLATRLVRRVQAEDGSNVLFNPNIWGSNDAGLASAALRAADARGTREVSSLLEEVSMAPGLPQDHVKSTERRWVDFAVSQGLVQRSVVQTTGGVERGFLFTPHLGRDVFGGTAGDASGHVRQLVGSMIYATTFAEYKLREPHAFVNRLLVNGVAGNASGIGSDYPMLEKAGIVRVVPGSGHNRFSMELLQTDVAEEALSILRDRDNSSGTSDGASALAGQSSYSHVDRERARLALTATENDVDQRKLMAALRQSRAGRSFGK